MTSRLITLRKEGLVKLLTGGEVLLQDQSDMLDPLQLKIVLHDECKQFISTELKDLSR